MNLKKHILLPNCVKWHPKKYLLAYVGEDKKSDKDESGGIYLFGLQHKW